MHGAEVWIALAIAVAVPSGGLFTVAYQVGRHAGELTTVLGQLKEIIDDHEDRLRVVERLRARR